MSTLHDDSTHARHPSDEPPHDSPANSPPPSPTLKQGLLSVALAVLFLALLAALAAGMWWWQTRPQRGAAVKIKMGSSQRDPNAIDRPRISSFELTDQQGQPFDSERMKGRIWVVNFFFSSCPGSCLKLNQQVHELARQYGPKGVQFVSITVDPDNDTPQVLAAYAERFDVADDRWTFVTGDQKLIESIGADIFNVATGKETHTDRIFIIGPDGKIAGDHYAFDPFQMQLARGTLNNLLKVQRRQQAPASETKPGESDRAADPAVDSPGQPAEGR